MSNFNYINDLDSLTNILDTLVFEDEPSIFTDEYAVDLVQTALHLMDEYMELHPHVISEPNFQEIGYMDIEIPGDVDSIKEKLATYFDSHDTL